MFARFRHALLVLLGFALVAVFIWFAGPYFAFGTYRPLASATSRLVALALVVAWWLGWRLARRLRALRTGDKLAAAVLRQPHPPADQPAPDVARLRERFEEAVAALRRGSAGRRSLYDLPWYVIIGAPGSGKTTALVNSGLRFPLEQRVGRGALRGVGGTRNCDWWFTDDAILLDTAGRYTTQDSDVASDSAGWREFLALLKKYRSRRPLNGVILTISAADLLTDREAERETHIEAARRRLNELNRELRIELPVYLLVTKCDLVAGFAEYFDDLGQEGRRQVWGVTFPYEQTTGGAAAAAYPAEFDALIERLNQRVLPRVEEDRDVRRRTKIFAFPQQMGALRDVLTEFVSGVFESTYLEHPVLLRGVYFTSGTQEGTPIDRLLGSIARRFGVASAAVPSPGGGGKAYFVERLLKDVIIAESGIAGLDRRGKMRKAAVQLGAYAAIAVLTVLGIVLLSVSAARNRAYVREVADAVAGLRKVPSIGASATLGSLVPRLDSTRAVVDVADQYRESTPWSMRWGLYQGRSLGNAARDAYKRELDGALLPRVAAGIREGLVRPGVEAETRYEYLKAYLMLGEPAHLDKRFLREFAGVEWPRLAPGTGDALARHFQSLLDYSDSLGPMPLDMALVAKVRGSLRHVSVPRIMYGRLRRRYASDTNRGVRLDVAAGAGADRVFRRASGVSLSQPVPSLYSRAVFTEASTVVIPELVKAFAGDGWVWGDSRLAAGNPISLAANVLDLYERDYIAVWDEVLDDLQLVPFATARETAAALETLAGGGSPLRGLVDAVVDNTKLVDSPQGGDESSSGALESAGKAISERVGEIVKPLVDASGAPAAPGAFVTAHFQPIHRLVVGEPGKTPLDQMLAAIGTVQNELQALGPAVGASAPLDALAKPELRDALQALHQQAADMPPAMRELVSDVGTNAGSVVAADATVDLDNRYREEVLEACREVVPGRYPFTSGSQTDVPLADFARLFGYDGVYDSFFRNNLAELVDTSRHPWAWRPGSVQAPRAMLETFEAAQRIRDVFFQPDASMPLVNVTLTIGGEDSDTPHVLLELDGVRYDDGRGRSRTVAARWPGPVPGSASVAFEEESKRPAASFDGPWAFFRLMDAAAPRRDGDTRFVLTFQQGRRGARVELEAASVRNPFVNREWRQFGCGQPGQGAR